MKKKEIEDVLEFIRELLSTTIIDEMAQEEIDHCITNSLKYISNKHSKKKKLKNKAKKISKAFIKSLAESGKIYAETNIRHF